jgi:hypothetical protein
VVHEKGEYEQRQAHEERARPEAVALTAENRTLPRC